MLTAEPNRAMQTNPPIENSEEVSLPRAYGTALSQLRSGHCIALNDYCTNIGLTSGPSYTECGSGDLHTTPHLFTCAANPTELVVPSL